MVAVEFDELGRGGLCAWNDFCQIPPLSANKKKKR